MDCEQDFHEVHAVDNSEGDHFLCGVVEGFYGKPWTTEQRSHLFRQLRNLGMNTYVYAPKDDLKHRAEWRILYTDEEAKLLGSLIRAAEESDICFVYALSPGTDIQYSNVDEVDAIKRKLSQVRSLGCEAFALLFDDIEPSMNDEDRRVFSSFATAQASVSNQIYEFVNHRVKCRLFCFCPTEYCESRAMPSLEESEYLNTVGTTLHPNIKILWTGPRVVSRLLTVEHADRVASVMRRPPLIWDNLHANDYDPKRIFLGPLTGRPLELRDHLAGLLLNPNSKFEANFIPLRTLADWHRPYREKRSLCSGTRSIGRAVEGRRGNTYDPTSSMQEAMEDWLRHFHHGPGPAIPPVSQTDSQTVEPMTIGSSALKVSNDAGASIEEIMRSVSTSEPVYTYPSTIAHTTSATSNSPQSFPVPLEPWRDGGKPLSEVVLGIPEPPEMIISQAVNSLASDYSEPMDVTGGCKGETNLDAGQAPDNCMEAKFAGIIDDESLTEDKIQLLTDIFYLPFEHGENGLRLLHDFEWLHHNAYCLRKSAADERKIEWGHRNESFKRSVDKFTALYKLVVESPNRSLVQEIFPYIWEAHGLLSVVVAIIDWMAGGNLLVYPSKGCSHWWNTDIDRDIEPWALGGGLLADMQRLIGDSSHMKDVFQVKHPIPLSLTCYAIRQAVATDLDKRVVYEFAIPFEKKAIEGMVGDGGGESSEELFFDRTITPFLQFGSPPHHFVSEEQGNEPRHCFSLVVGLLNVRDILERYRREFVPQYKSKHTERINEQHSVSEREKAKAKKLLCSDIDDFPLCHQLPEQLMSDYPSMVEFRWRHYSTEAVSVRRLFHTISATLSMNGSSGFFTIVSLENVEKIELLTRLGLNRIETGASFANYVFMGHAL